MPKEGPIVREKAVRRPGARRQAFMIVVIIVVLAAVLGLAYFIFSPKQERYTLSSYTYAEVERGEIIETLQLSGVLTLKHTENVLSPQAGIVTAVHASEGEEITQGRVIAEINPEDLEDVLEDKQLSYRKKKLDYEKLLRQREIEIEKLEAEKAELEENLNEAEVALERAKTLSDAGSLSKNEYQSAVDEVKDAERALEEYKRQKETARLNYNYSKEVLEIDLESLRQTMAALEQDIAECIIESPLSGKVMEVFVSGGDLVSQFGKLMRIADLSRPIVTVQIPENKISGIYSGQPVDVSIGDRIYPARIDTVALEAEDSGEYESTVEAVIAFDEKPEMIVPGSTVGVEIVLGKIENTLYLPRGPYLTTGDQLYLYRIEGEHAYRREVNFGIITSNKVEVRSGAAEGDHIITSGYQDFITYETVELEPSGGRSVDDKEQ
jgi:HlyD family secretion protein